MDSHPVVCLHLPVFDSIKKLLLTAVLILAPLLLFIVCFLCSSIVPNSHLFGNSVVHPVWLSVFSVVLSELFLLVLNKAGVGYRSLIILSISTLFWMIYLITDIRLLLFLYPAHTLNYEVLFHVSIIELSVWTTALLCRFHHPAHPQKTVR